MLERHPRILLVAARNVASRPYVFFGGKAVSIDFQSGFCLGPLPQVENGLQRLICVVVCMRKSLLGAPLTRNNLCTGNAKVFAIPPKAL